MTQYRIVITLEWLSTGYNNTILSHIPQLLQYDTESFHIYYNMIQSYTKVITIQYWVIPELLQYDTGVIKDRIVIPVEWLNTVL
jgi:hypothetical protein